MPSDELKKLSIENAPKRTKTSAGLETVDETVARAKAMTASKPPVITPETLSPQPTPTLTPPATPTEAPALQADLAVQAEDAFTKQQEQKAQTAETAKTSALDEYLAAIRATQGETDLTSELYGEKGGVDDITLELNDINDQIRKEQRALELAKRDITERGGGLASGAAAEIGNLERVSLQKQADLSIIQMGIQGRYDSAKAIADRAVAAQLEKQKILNEALRVNYEDKKAEWTTAEQREFETLLGNRERAYQERQQQLTDIKDFALSALQAGAPVSSVQRAMGAKSLDEAMSLVGSYLRPKATTAKAPDLQNFGTADNPIWKQWNATTSSWEDVTGVSPSGQTATESQQSLDNLTMLRDATARILGERGYEEGLFTASGPSEITKRAGDIFVGDTKYRQLENYADTLKTNVLALTTDPSIRKFFGPQMSNADVQLIQSAGSTLRPSSQTPQQLKDEVKRLDTLFNRMQTAVRNGQNQERQQVGIGEQVITAPDGRQIIITE